MQTVYLGLGSNMGDRQDELNRAYEFLNTLGKITDTSPIYETAAMDMQDAPPFLNSCCMLETEMEPKALIQAFHQYDEQRGRERTEGQYLSRPIDIDILMYGSYCFMTPTIHIPHPRMAERRFVLQPFNDIAPDVIIPGLDVAVQTALAQCNDNSQPIRIH